MTLPPEARAQHHRWLLELTQIPTASGREWRVVDWLKAWLAERPQMEMVQDSAGNLDVRFAEDVRDRSPTAGVAAPIYFTAHLDHPAFVVSRIVGPGTVQLEFRGGVMEDYFRDARVVIYSRDNARHPARLTGKLESKPPALAAYLAELESETGGIGVGDVATWELPPAEIADGVLHTNACDDLAAAAAALAAYDELLGMARAGEPVGDVRLLFTRAEEIGFVGAIAACREKTMPAESRVLALENSRSFDDSPIGGGPIVRVGDRISVFSPGLTAAVAKCAERIAGGPAIPTAQQKASERGWKWQRKLMPGGACEATVFCEFGYEATCLCLPLGNYHNMADLAAVQAGTNAAPARVGREFISLYDFDGLVDLLVECGRGLPESPGARGLIEKLWAERAGVLKE